MTMTGNSVICDGCGADVVNGDLYHCDILSRIDRETGAVENLHFCLDREDGKGKKVQGCSSKMATPARLSHYHAQRKQKQSS